MQPTVIVGPPGCGKTTFLQRICELLELPFEMYSCAGVNDSSMSGTARRWASGEPAMPTALVVSTGLANPSIILDEAEKAATSNYNGKLLDALLPFLEPRSASKYHDIFVQASVDLDLCLNAGVNSSTRRIYTQQAHPRRSSARRSAASVKAAADLVLTPEDASASTR